MKKFLCIVAVLLALTLMLTPVAPTASAAGSAPGTQVSVTFTYDNIVSLNGEFTFSNPAIIAGNVSYSWTRELDGDVSNNKAFFTARDVTAPKSLSITVTFTISDTAAEGDTCDVALTYEIYNEFGDLDAAGTDKRTVTVVIPETQPTQPSTKPSTTPTTTTRPSTQPTTPTQPTTQPVVPTQPTTLPTVPTEPTEVPTVPTEPTTPVKPTQPPQDCDRDNGDCSHLVTLCWILGILVLLLTAAVVILLFIIKKQQRHGAE